MAKLNKKEEAVTPGVNKIIIHDNKYCQVITDNISIINSLRRILSFKMAGVEYTSAYQNGWNGLKYLIDKKGVFYAGLLSKVIDYFKKSNINFEIDNRLPPIDKQSEIDISQKLEGLKLVPREHQQRIIDVVMQNNKGIVRACTGSGKTLSIAAITAKINKPTIIYVIGLDLLKQFHNLFSSIFDEPIGYIGDGVCNIHRINIASIWTIGRSLNIKNVLSDDECENNEKDINSSQREKILNMLKTTKVHVFDESHVVTTDTISQIYKIINPEHIYGFSGTPFRDDNSNLLINGILGEQLINIGASELIEKKILSQPIIKFITVPAMRNAGTNYQSVYKNYIIENDVRNNLILKNTLSLLSKGYIPLVLFKSIKHGEILLDLFKQNNVKCEMLYGNDSLERRTKVKQMIENKEIDLLLASTIFDIGIDLPILNSLVLCGGGKSSIRCLQRIGRCIRQYPGKQFSAVVDFYDQAKFLKKHSMIRYSVYKSEDGFKIIKSKEMA